MSVKPALSKRLEEVGRTAAISLGKRPLSKPLPPKKEKEEPVSIDSLVSRGVAMEVKALVEESMEYKDTIDAAEKKRAKCTKRLKELVEKNGLESALVNDFKLLYFNAPRSSLDRDLLLMLNVSPKIIQEATVTRDVYTLKITKRGDVED